MRILKKKEKRKKDFEIEEERKKTLREIKRGKNNMPDNPDADDGSSSDDALGDDESYHPLTESDLRLDSVLLDDIHT